MRRKIHYAYELDMPPCGIDARGDVVEVRKTLNPRAITCKTCRRLWRTYDINVAIVLHIARRFQRLHRLVNGQP